jgi:putative hemolysin
LISLYFSLSVIFLIWTFILSCVTHSLIRLGETLASESLNSPSFFYYPMHRSLFKKRQFELLIFSSKIAENIGRVGFACTATLAIFSEDILYASTIVISFFIAFLLIFILCDLLPRILSGKAPGKLLPICALLASLFLYLSLPLSYALIKLADLALKKERQTIEPLEEMKEIIVEILQSANIKGKLNQADRKLIESVVLFKDLIVREAMIPRVDLFALPANSTIRQAASKLAKEGYSRVPVYRGTIDNVVGMLMYKDILEIYMECETGEKEWKFLETKIETIAKTVFYIPETSKVSHLLQEFRSKQMHMAIVVDEYGGTAGVVTIEDLLEEIVGDIADEYDVEEEVLYTSQSGGGSWIVDGRMNIKDAEDTFDITIPQEGDYDTIGGYLFHKLGSVPEKGILLHHEDFDLEVLSSTDRSVEKVRLTPHRHEST